MRRDCGLFTLLIEQDVGIGRLHGAGCELAHVLVVEGVPEMHRSAQSVLLLWRGKTAADRGQATEYYTAMLRSKRGQMCRLEPAVINLSRLHAAVAFVQD